MALDHKFSRFAGTSFEAALASLGERLGLSVRENPMPISKFKADYGSLLRGASEEVQQISQGRHRFVVLTEDQVITMAGMEKQRKSLGDVLRSIPQIKVQLDRSSLFIPGTTTDQFSLNSRK